MILKHISGAQTLIVIFVGTSFLTKFGLSTNFIYAFLMLYSTVYLLIKFTGKEGLNKSSLILVLHYIILSYLIVVFLISELVNFSSLPHFWNGLSVLVYASALMAQIVVLKTPNKHIMRTLTFIKNISYFIILESILSFILPDSIDIFLSDQAAGHRFTSLLTPGYVFTGLFLILGYTVALYLNSFKPNKRSIIFIFVLFCFALIQTKDRTSILTFIFINLFIIYNKTHSKVFVLSVFKKISFIAKSILIIVALYFSMHTFTDKVNIMSISSLLDRHVLFIRGVRITKEVLPIGGGPGSQVRLMYTDQIHFDNLIYNISFKNDNLINAFESSVEYVRKKIGSGMTISTHNTYLDYSISLGIIGIIIVMFVLFVQIKSVYFLVKNKKTTCFFDAMFAASFIIFMNTSFINFMWLFLIMYRVWSQTPSATVKQSYLKVDYAKNLY
jgi:hypothetical protein